MTITWFTYLLRIEYLGFRYSGWQIQPGQRTVEGMLTKTINFIRPSETFKLLSSGRTDAKVSALHAACELFVRTEITDTGVFLSELNRNLPPDIRVKSLSVVNQSFNIIQGVATKTYVYLFCFGKRMHPFCAPFMSHIFDNLNIDEMQKAARLFEGTRSFHNYTIKERKNHAKLRTITTCRIIENTLLSANFFPDTSYMLEASGTGFARYQIRLMMGALIDLGRGALSFQTLKKTLEVHNITELTTIAPGSGLHLKEVVFPKP